MNPFNTFGPDFFTYLKQIFVQIKENITGKTASGFCIFLQNTGPKQQVYKPSPLQRKNARCRLSPPSVACFNYVTLVL